MRIPETCWLHPSVEVMPSALGGSGLFATERIPEGEPVSRLGGRLVTDRELEAMLKRRKADPSLPYVDSIIVGEDQHLVLPPGVPNRYGNHSCDPNLWWIDGLTLGARQEIRAGEELTNDYSTSTADPAFRVTCRCGSRRCRGIISGNDWRDPELQDRYGRHWVPALLALIDLAH